MAGRDGRVRPADCAAALDSRKLRPTRGSWWAHDENRVAEGIHEIECPRSPDLVLRRTPNVDAVSPLLVIGVGIFYLQRDACVSAVTGHRAIKRDIDRASLQAQESVLAVLRHFKAHTEAQAVDIERFPDAEIIRRQYRCGSLHRCLLALSALSLGAKRDRAFAGWLTSRNDATLHPGCLPDDRSTRPM